ncbi:MAG: hypothetical protein QOJ54_3624 [Aliidongia sp.]|nr:hypothetical protein [Aliidongia sp.]
MMGEPDAADAVIRARGLPGLKVGLHIVLVEGTPVLPPEEIPDLVDAEGRFPSDMVTAGFRFFFRPGVRRQLAREIRAQFTAFARTGLPLDHANTHKHIHLHPTVASLIIRIGREFGLKAMRLPVEPTAPVAAAEPGRRPGGFGDAALRLWTRQLRWKLRHAGLVTNDQVFGLAWSGAMTEERVLRLIPHLPDGVSELYFHPARELTPRLARTMPSYRHREEFEALLSPRIDRALAQAGIARTSYTALAREAA